MITQTRHMLSGQIEQLIIDFRQLAQASQTSSAQREQLLKTANYFERNLPYMDYPTYLAHGWPLASGVIEGACRHFVKDRCELSGMRWSQTGTENLLRLRAIAENDNWDAYHLFRRCQRHVRLYGSTFPTQIALENRVLDEAQGAFVPQPITDPCTPYHKLPLAG